MFLSAMKLPIISVLDLSSEKVREDVSLIKAGFSGCLTAVVYRYDNRLVGFILFYLFLEFYLFSSILFWADLCG